MTLQKGYGWKVSETKKEEMRVLDEAFERGYNQGYRHGVEDQKNEAIWNLPEAIPQDGELVQVIHLPYNWRTRRLCRKRKIQWLMTNGIFLSGRKLWEDNHEPDEPWDEEEWPDALIISPKMVIGWKDAVLLWHSAEVPEWFVKKYKGEGDS